MIGGEIKLLQIDDFKAFVYLQSGYARQFVN